MRLLRCPAYHTGVAGMLTVETIARVRHDYFLKGTTIREIGRDLLAGCGAPIASR